jgi:competence protein ComEC
LRWSGETLRLHLRDRAAYYLSRPALAVYLPVVLGIRERDTPEARQVAAAFRHAGVAHLFAISGLHVGLLYVLFYGLQRWGLGWLQWGQGSPYAPGLRRASVLVAVWLYIALIGWPIPATRAALMGTLLIWNESRGTRSPPLYILAVAALLLLAGDPSQLYDVSFQLSFLAVFFLLCALGLQPRLPPWQRRRRRDLLARGARLLLAGAFTSLWLTAFITLGLWPVVAATFGQLSLMVFVGNLVMIPLLGWVILPLGLAGLGASLLRVGASPDAWIERLAFALLDPVLRGWVWLAEGLDRLGEAWIVTLRLELPAGAVLGYYAALLAALGWAQRIRKRAAARANGPGKP